MHGMQALQLWLQYLTLLAGVNMPTPYALRWVFSAAKYAFAAVAGGSFSADCLLSGHHNTALQSILVHLIVPLLVLAAMLVIQGVWCGSLVSAGWFADSTGNLTMSVSISCNAMCHAPCFAQRASLLHQP